VPIRRLKTYVVRRSNRCPLPHRDEVGDQVQGARMATSARRVRSDNRPLYARTVDALREMIDQGTYRAGDPLPSEEMLGQQLGVSRSTLREAISNLAKEGLIVRRQGVGTFVAAPSPAHVLGGLERLQSFRELAGRAGLPVETCEREVSQVMATQECAAILDVPVDSALVRVQAVISAGGCRMAYLDSLVRPDCVDPDNLREADGSLFDYLVVQPSLTLAYAKSEVFAIDADDALATRLGVVVGKSLLYLAEAFYLEDDRPIAWSRNYFLTECFNFTIFRRIYRSRERVADVQ
jgi:GntR family transcriptional regulator